MSIFLSTANYFRGFINTLERFETTTSQRKNGCLMGQPLCMVVLLNWEPHWNMIFRRRKILATKGFQWMRLSIILRYSFQGYGKSIFLEKAIQERRQCSSSNICSWNNRISGSVPCGIAIVMYRMVLKNGNIPLWRRLNKSWVYFQYSCGICFSWKFISFLFTMPL